MKRFYFVLLGLLFLINLSYAQFKYEQPIYVKNNTSTALTDIQVLLRFNTAIPIANGWMQSDGKDIVFTSICGGISYLSHYVEAYLNTDSTKIWVKVPSIGASDSTLIFINYGNAGATNISTLSVFGGPVSATDSVVSPTSGGSASTQRGFKFTPNEDVLVAYFGKRVPNADSRYVTLFDFNSQAIIYQTQVSAGTLGVYNYDLLANPFWLISGTAYILEVYQGTGDGYYYGSSSQINPRLTYGDMRYCNSCTQNTFPTSILTSYHYGNPDLMFYYKQNVTPAPTARILLTADTLAPAAPTGVTATPGSGQATIKWIKNTEFDMAQYKVYKNTSNTPGTATLVGTTNQPDTTIIATGLANGTWYFWVQAVDSYCNPKSSAYSTVASCSLGGLTYAVPELMYYRMKNNPSSTLTPNYASAPVGTNPAPVLNATTPMGPGGQFDSCLIGSQTPQVANLGGINMGWNWNLSGSWTISFWLGANVTDGNPSYICGDIGATTFRIFYGGIAGANTIGIRGPVADVYMTGIYTSAAMVCTIVYDGTNIIIYKNGVVFGTYPRTFSATAGTGFRVGSYNNTVVSQLCGNLDEFRLYNRAVSATEIGATWNHELPYTVVGIEPGSNNVPDKYTLLQNYPNPFNPTTTIKYGLIKQTNVELTVYDALGRLIKTLVKGNQSAGYHEVTFNGQELSSGVYYYRITAGEFSEVKKMVLIK